VPKHFIDGAMNELKLQDSTIYGWAWQTNLFRRARELKRAMLQKEISFVTAFKEIESIR
jgi:hypothetical protein